MATRQGAPRQGNDRAADELNSIKRLLILQLVTSGVQAKDIASVLGVDKSAVSRLVSARKVKKTAKKR